MRRSRRHVRVPPDLTSLFDVLFIVIFAALIRAAAAQAQVAALTAKPAPAPSPVALDPASLRARAIANVDAELHARPTIVVRVSGAGSITAIESAGKRLALDTPLVEPSADPDVALAYIGDRSADLRLCRIAALDLGLRELASYLVIIAPDRRLADLPHALFDGLHRDLDRCIVEQHALATIVEPGP
ncbi:MAG TPA: hypothetical protein VGL61_16665 [Kofleriaceae bacterium]